MRFPRTIAVLSVAVSSALAFAPGACSSSGGGNEQATLDSGSGEGQTGSSSGGGHAGSGSSSGAGSGSGSTSIDASSGGSDSGSKGSSDGGAPDGSNTDGAMTAEGGLFDPTEVLRVSNWLNDPNSGLENYAYTNIAMYFPAGSARDRLVNSIVGTCAAFAPRLPNWQMYCEAIETSQIVSESSYVPGNPTPGPPSTPSVNYDAYATQNGSNDPTVGLLQVRYSSTVHDYNYYGPLSTIAAIGCSWPAGLATQTDTGTYWRTSGGTSANLAFMEDPACNIPLAAWYVFTNATGNGGATPIYAADYCAGKGVAGNVVDGLLSHLDGPAYPRPADASNSYPAGIKMRFTKLLGGLPSPDPFGVTLSPSVSQYCK